MVSAADPAARRPDRYERLGRSYRQTRREDPRIAARIRAALGDARSVLNVGAGAGSYEPPRLRVVAAEPAAVMIRQRPDGAAPALRAVAEALPLPRDCLDGFGEAFWARPEAYLDPVVRAGMSAFGLLTEAERRPGIDRLEADLASGAWQARHAAARA